MPRARAHSQARKDERPDAQPLDDVWRSQLRWFDQMVSWQTSWLAICLSLQADIWRNWSAGSQELPAWMVWHNGTEQLA
jgi:hypothetical protein